MSELRIGVIGGSGIGRRFAAGPADTAGVTTGVTTGDAAVVCVNVVDTPFGPPSGPITEVDWHGTRVLLLPRHGPGHTLNPSRVPYRANLFALKKLGVTHVLATGAVGSLRVEMKPGDLVVADQIIDKTARAGTFYDDCAVHVPFAEPFCPVLRAALLAAADGGDAFKTHAAGTYVAMEGPAFSTRAESLMHRLWGGDLIGMTAMPEAKLAREAELPYALVALVTDYDSWQQPPPPEPEDAPAGPVDPAALLKEIVANLDAASTRAVDLIRRTIAALAADPAPLAACPAATALAHAIWSDKSRIPPHAVGRLAPLWVRYFRPPAE